MLPSEPAKPSEGGDRRIAFLVSTTPLARGIREHLGAPAYSYYFVFEALRPVLERLGTWRLIEHPESSLAFAAARAEAEGFRPVHLALNPPQEVYLAPGVPNVLFPFWEFPDIPDRDFGHDTRQNWARISRRADLIVTACRFTAGAFRRAGLACPVAVVPVPIAEETFAVPHWEPTDAWTMVCRHEVWGGRPIGGRGEIRESPAATAPVRTTGAWGLARRSFRRLAPWLDPATVGRLCRVKQAIAGQSPARLAYRGMRAAYRRTLRLVLSDEAIDAISAAKVAALRRLGQAPTTVIDPLLPMAPLTVSGLVYTSFANVGDRRKNLGDLLSAFLLAFRERPDVTLVLKLASSPHREHHEMAVLRGLYRGLGIEHACRVAVIPDYLDDAQMAGLMRATAYYVNTSHAEGACLPLQQALAAGRPAIAPDHTAMADYMGSDVGFVVGASVEPTHWPHDPEERITTERHRIHWSDLHEAFLSSAEVAETDRPRYLALSTSARDRMGRLATIEAATVALREALIMQDSVKIWEIRA